MSVLIIYIRAISIFYGNAREKDCANKVIILDQISFYYTRADTCIYLLSVYSVKRHAVRSMLVNKEILVPIYETK